MDRRGAERGQGAPTPPGRADPASPAASPGRPHGEPHGVLRLPTGVLTTTATGHRATVVRCRCGLPVGGEGLDPSTDPEPGPEVRTVTVLGQVPGVLRWERGDDGLWHAPRTRYQQPGPPQVWSALGECVDRRRHRVVAVG